MSISLNAGSLRRAMVAAGAVIVGSGSVFTPVKAQESSIPPAEVQKVPDARFGQMVEAMEEGWFDARHPFVYQGAGSEKKIYTLESVISFNGDPEHAGKRKRGSATCMIFGEDNGKRNAFCILNMNSVQAEVTYPTNRGQTALPLDFKNLQDSVFAKALEIIQPTGGYLVMGTFRDEHIMDIGAGSKKACYDTRTWFYNIASVPIEATSTVPKSGDDDSICFAKPREVSPPPGDLYSKNARVGFNNRAVSIIARGPAG